MFIFIGRRKSCARSRQLISRREFFFSNFSSLVYKWKHTKIKIEREIALSNIRKGNKKLFFRDSCAKEFQNFSVVVIKLFVSKLLKLHSQIKFSTSFLSSPAFFDGFNVEICLCIFHWAIKIRLRRKVFLYLFIGHKRFKWLIMIGENVFKDINSTYLCVQHRKQVVLVKSVVHNCYFSFLDE